LRRLKADQYNRAMFTDTQVAFIGGGNMTEALVRGLLRQRLFAPGQLAVSDPLPGRREWLATQYGVMTGADNRAAVQGAGTIVLSVEPQVLDSVLEELRLVIAANPLLLSVAAGYPLSRITQHAGTVSRVVRAMPNTPSMIGEGVTALTFAADLSPEDRARASRIFEAVGSVVVVEERLMDAVTGLSGSGPAYVYAMIEALADGGVQVGLPRATAQTLAAHTLAGAARMVLDSGEHPAVLKDRVASPGGTTIAGLRSLEEGRLRATLMSAVEAAVRRSHELGQSASQDL